MTSLEVSCVSPTLLPAALPLSCHPKLTHSEENWRRGGWHEELLGPPGRTPTLAGSAVCLDTLWSRDELIRAGWLLGPEGDHSHCDLSFLAYLEGLNRNFRFRGPSDAGRKSPPFPSPFQGTAWHREWVRFGWRSPQRWLGQDASLKEALLTAKTSGRPGPRGGGGRLGGLNGWGSCASGLGALRCWARNARGCLHLFWQVGPMSAQLDLQLSGG